MPELAFDHFYGYDELTSFLESCVEERPDLVAIESIGSSWEGRDIWLVTLTNRDTGPPLAKPGFLVEANVHAVEWTGGVAALHLLQRLVRDHGSDDKVTRLLDTRCVYVVPRLNPDGVEHALGAGRFIRSSVRPHPQTEQPPGLRAGDVDGDGRHLFMRVRDPNGPFEQHPDEPRLLVPREPDDDDGGEYFRLYPEGEIAGFDGVTVTVSPPLEGLDLGANFPGDHTQDTLRTHAGAFPGSEPEIAAYMRAVVARPNITGYVTCHTFGGGHLRSPHNADEDLPVEDERAYRILGDKATSLTGYRALSWVDLKTDQRMIVRGAQSQWFYDSLGVFSWITEFWSPFTAAGIDLGDYSPSRWLYGEHPAEHDLALIRWSDSELAGKGFVDWYLFDHPQLGPVELGGWDKINYWYNAPFDRLEAEVAPHTEWLIFHALASPLLEVRAASSERLEDGLYRVRLVVQNTGWLPTNVTKRALDRGLVPPVKLEIALRGEARLASGEPSQDVGQLAGRTEQRGSTTWWSYQPETRDIAVADWVVAASAGSSVELTATHPRAGAVSQSVELV